MTVNSDDPSYFGGYMNDNFFAIQQALDLTNDELKQLAINSLKPLSFQMKRNKSGFQKSENLNKNRL